MFRESWLPTAVSVPPTSSSPNQTASSAEWITQRENRSLSSANLVENKNALMFDSAADQCTCRGPSWDIAFCTNKTANCYNHSINEWNLIFHNLSIVGACPVITPSNGIPFIGLFHQMTRNKSPNQNESLASPFQLIEHVIQVDLTPKCYPDV